MNEQALAQWGLSRQEQTKKTVLIQGCNFENKTLVNVYTAFFEGL